MSAPVVIVSTSASSPHRLASLLRDDECHVLGATDDLIRAVDELAPAVIVVDVDALGERGIRAIASLAGREPHRTTSILAYVAADAEAIDQARSAGATDFCCSTASDAEAIERTNRLRRRAPPPSQRDTTQNRKPSAGAAPRLDPYAELFEHAENGVLLIETSGKILYANSKAHDLAEQGGSIVGANVADFLEPREQPRARLLKQEFLEGRFPKNMDFLLCGKQRAATVNVSFSSTLQGDGAVLITLREVTKERATERELKQARQFLERVIDSSVDAIVAADLDGNVLLFNRAAARIFGYEPDQVIRKLNVELLYPQGVARDVMRKIREDGYGGAGRLEGYAVDMQDAAGRLVPVRISAALIYEGGGPSGSVGIFKDVREELRMEARLREAQEAIRHHEKGVAVAQLAGATAHELNQPLTVVIAYAELLALKLDPSDPLHDAAEVIGEQADRMANIVRQVGKITRYETKSYVGNTQILDLEKASKDDPLD